MKKYITAVAFVVAGSSLVNAASSVVWDMDFTSSGVVFVNEASGVTVGAVSGAQSEWISNGAITLENNKFSFSQTAGQVSYAEEFSLVVTISLGEQQTGNWPVLFSLGETNSWYWKASYYTETGVFNLDKDGFTNVDQSQKNAGNISYSPGEKVDVSLVSDGKGKVSLYVDGEEAGHTMITNPADYGSDKKLNNFTFGGRNGNNNNKANITIYDAVLYKGIVIPEPSAFGLLAGVGVLALVASRRRRK